MQPLRIAILTTSFPIDKDSVSGIFVKHLADALSNKSQIEVLVPAGAQPTATESEYPVSFFRYAPKRFQTLSHSPGGIPVALKKNKWNYLLLPLFLSSMFLSTLRTAIRSDVIQANWSINGVIAGLVGKVTNTPVITTLRGEDNTRAQSALLDLVILKACLFLSSRIVVVSSEMKKTLVNNQPKAKQKIHFIPNGVNEDLLSLPLAGNQESKSQRLRLVAIGSLIERKGLWQTITALANIDKSCRPTLNIIGDGVLKKELLTLSEQRGVTDSIVFSGQLAQHDVFKALKNSDVLVLNSYSEGRPNVVIEAMAAGRVIIATEISGVTELIDNNSNGLLYRPEDIDQLTEHIQSLITDMERREHLAHKARQTIISQNISWQETAGRYIHLINEVAH